jgi:hypothetical protein
MAPLRMTVAGGLLTLDENAAFLKGLSHEIDFKNFDKKLHNLA